MIIRYIILFLLICLRGTSQQIYLFDNNDSLGIADLSSGLATKWFQGTGNVFNGPTVDICVLPDGRLYRSTLIWGSLIPSLTEPIFENVLQNAYNIDNNGLFDYAKAVSCNYNSVLFVSCFKTDTSVWSHGILEAYDIVNKSFNVYSSLDNYYQSISCVGDKLLAIEEVLSPYRHYNLFEVNLSNTKLNRFLFQIDSSFWPIKIYAPKNYLSPYLNMFNIYETCDSVQVYVSNFIRYNDFTYDSIIQTYRIDFRNKTLIDVSLIKLKQPTLSGAIEGINPFGFINNCSLDFDLDLNNSTATGRSYYNTYLCPKEKFKLHDSDWDYYCDGPLDSIQVEIEIGIRDIGEENIVATYLPPGLIAYGNNSNYLRLIPTKKFYTNEIKKILDGIVYKNNKQFPSVGAREIRISVFVPWLEDTAWCKLSIPLFESAGRDSSITICPDGTIYQLENFLEDGGIRRGTWLENDIPDGILIAGKNGPRDYHFLLDRGTCDPDTAIIRVNYYNDIDLSIGNDTVLVENSFLKLIINAPLIGTERIKWFKNNVILIDTGATLDIIVTENSIYKVEILNKDGCLFEDEVIIRVNSDKDFWISNIFSPNSDNINDVFYMRSKFEVQIKTFEIFDRWGNKVFSKQNIVSNDSSSGWDGTFMGNKLLNGVYIFALEVVNNSGKVYKLRGDVLLIY
jgi:gliding motility-associated-like protein